MRAWTPSFRGRNCWPSSNRSIPTASADARPSDWSAGCGGCFLQPWYGLADEAREDALHDSQALQGFARIDLADEGVPDATALLKFRRLLEPHDLCKGRLAAINAGLSLRRRVIAAHRVDFKRRAIACLA